MHCVDNREKSKEVQMSTHFPDGDRNTHAFQSVNAKLFIPVVLVALVVTVASFFVMYIGSRSSSTPSDRGPLSFEPPGGLQLYGVRVGNDAPFNAIVRNISDEEVRIDSVDASCSCTSVQVEPRVIPPGGVARLSGVIKSRPGDQVIGSSLSLLVSRGEDMSKYPVKYSVSGKTLASVSWATSFHEAIPIPGTDRYSCGDITIASLCDDEVTIEVKPSMFSPNTLRVVPCSGTLGSGQELKVSVDVDRLPERDGRLVLSIDGGKENHSVPIRVVMHDHVSVNPNMMVLGHLSEHGGSVKSSFPPHLSFRGKVLRNYTIAIRQCPEVLCNPRLAKVSDSEWSFDCELSSPLDAQKVQGSVQFYISDPEQTVTQTIDVPFVGIVKKAE